MTEERPLSVANWMDWLVNQSINNLHVKLNEIMKEFEGDECWHKGPFMTLSEAEKAITDSLKDVLPKGDLNA